MILQNCLTFWQSQWNLQVQNKFHAICSQYDVIVICTYRNHVVLCRLCLGHTLLPNSYLFISKLLSMGSHCNTLFMVVHILFSCLFFNMFVITIFVLIIWMINLHLFLLHTFLHFVMPFISIIVYNIIKCPQ